MEIFDCFTISFDDYLACCLTIPLFNTTCAFVLFIILALAEDFWVIGVEALLSIIDEDDMILGFKVFSLDFFKRPPAFVV